LSKDDNKLDGHIVASEFTPTGCTKTDKSPIYYSVVENIDDVYDEGVYDFENDITYEFNGDDLDDLCEEEKKFECPANFFEAVKRLKGLLVAVEFECGDCCKKAVGILRCVEPDFVQLFRPPGGLVTVQIFCPGVKTCDVECACEINIKFKRIISVEQLANQKCPPVKFPPAKCPPPPKKCP